VARLDLGDVDLQCGTITIRETKFFKTRILPLPDTVMAELRAYLDARRRAGAPQDPQSGLFWHDQGNGRYTSAAIAWLLVDILRRAELKPQDGRTGPRLHDLRHSMVVNRILQWYRVRRQSAGQAAVPRNLSGAPGYQLDVGLHHRHTGPAAGGK
jgi:integrase